MKQRTKFGWYVFMGFMLIMALAVGSCEKKENGTAPGQSSASETDGSAGPFSQEGMASISDNPAFFASRDLVPSSAPVKDLDALIRPVLVKLFGGAKLIEEVNSPVTERDGEVILNSMKYSVKLLLDGPAGDELHQALKQDAHFSSTPRLGAKPVHGRKKVAMSLSKSTSRSGYSLVLSLDLVNQFIEIRSYKLGSKYDRLM